MRKVKLYITQSIYHNEYGDPEWKIKGEVHDWTEISDEEYEFLMSNIRLLEDTLRSKNIMQWNEQIFILRKTLDEDFKAIKSTLTELLDSIKKEKEKKEEQARARLERNKKRLEKLEEKKKKEQEKAELNIVNTINDPASKLQNNQLDKVA